MPITASSGALTYAKAINNVNPDYWFIQPSGADLSDFNFLLVDSASEEIYVSSNASGLYSYFTSLNSLSNPNIKYLSRLANSAGGSRTLNLNMQFVQTSANDVWLPGKHQVPGTQFPNPLQNWGILVNINPSTGITGTGYGYTPEQIADEPGYILEIRQAAFVSALNSGWLAWYQDNPYQFHQVGIFRIGASGAITDELKLAFNDPKNTTGGLKLTNANEDPIILHSIEGIPSGTNARPPGVILRKIDKTPVAPNPTTLVVLWNMVIEQPTALGAVLSVTPTDLNLDSDDNSYFTFYDSLSGIGYLAKVDTNGTLQWQRQIASTNLYGVVIKSDTEIYVIGVTSTNKLWIAEFNESGTVQWQNEMIGSSAFTKDAFDKSTAKIDYYDNNLYLGANGGYISNQWSVSKVPDDGTIVGNGEYVFPDGSIITYQTSSQTVTTSTLTISSSASTQPQTNNRGNSTGGAIISQSTPAKAIAFPLE